MRSVKFKNKRLKRRSRLQRGGWNEIIITKEQIQNNDYDFEIITYQDKNHLVIKKTPPYHRSLIGLSIIYGRDGDDTDHQLQTINNLKNLQKLHNVEDFKQEAIRYENIRLNTSDITLVHYTNMLKTAKIIKYMRKNDGATGSAAPESGENEIRRPEEKRLEQIRLGGKRKPRRKSKRKSRKRKSHRRKTRRY